VDGTKASGVKFWELKQMENTITVLAWLVFLTLILAIARQLSEQTELHSMYYTRTTRMGDGLLEGFKSIDDVVGNMSPVSMEPGLVKLENPRESFNLLNDVLQPVDDKKLYTAQSCYSNDFLAQTTKTGNYIQRTNNFRHAAPDNCSTPLTELTGSFYKNP
jgi:hypothetical protein